MRPSLLLTVFATSASVATAQTVLPMLCHRGMSSDADVQIVLTGGDKVDWISDGGWVLNVNSLKDFKCMVDGQNIRNYPFGHETPNRHELQLLCRKWYYAGWTDFIRPVTVRVGGGQEVSVIDEDNTELGVKFFNGTMQRYCLVLKLLSIS
ncbi:hypothetical protein CP533_6791 [Ophiocordyceps camponoti-saundersi (nom. inval.)]|nr:hypothetical protein CP533_6791 [Ophiocordyceps camponoti-saundersi (nom. inval.)]